MRICTNSKLHEKYSVETSSSAMDRIFSSSYNTIIINNHMSVLSKARYTVYMSILLICCPHQVDRDTPAVVLLQLGD